MIFHLCSFANIVYGVVHEELNAGLLLIDRERKPETLEGSLQWGGRFHWGDQNTL